METMDKIRIIKRYILIMFIVLHAFFSCCGVYIIFTDDIYLGLFFLISGLAFAVFFLKMVFDLDKEKHLDLIDKVEIKKELLKDGWVDMNYNIIRLKKENLINDKYLIEWINLNYPMMEIDRDTDLCELDYYDMEKFSKWLVEKNEANKN